MDTLAFLAKTGIALTTWWIVARMFYRNEMECPENERVGDHGTIQILCVLWPLLACGIVITALTGMLAVLIIGTTNFLARVSYRLALLYHLYRRRKEKTHVDTAKRNCRCQAGHHATH